MVMPMAGPILILANNFQQFCYNNIFHKSQDLACKITNLASSSFFEGLMIHKGKYFLGMSLKDLVLIFEIWITVSNVYLENVPWENY